MVGNYEMRRAVKCGSPFELQRIISTTGKINLGATVPWNASSSFEKQVSNEPGLTRSEDVCIENLCSPPVAFS
jgi:hypothetical protein